MFQSNDGQILQGTTDFEGHWGMRIESALLVQKVQVKRFLYLIYLMYSHVPPKTKGNFQGDIWLGFKRFTRVPIQTRMVKGSILSKEERLWLKVMQSFDT